MKLDTPIAELLSKWFKKSDNDSTLAPTVGDRPNLAEVISLPPAPKKEENKISIAFRDGRVQYFTLAPWAGTDPNEPWQEFISWYFDTDEDKDDSYMFKYDKGSVVFRREDIRRFDINVSEIKSKAK